MSDLGMLINTAATVIGLVVLIVLFRIDPVVSLFLGSLYLGISSGVGLTETVKQIVTGFGDVMAEIGLLIAFGVLLGTILNEMGAIQRLVDVLLRIFGPKALPYSLAVTVATMLQSIYIDVLIVITSPLVKPAARRMGPLGFAKMTSALTIGLYSGLALMVPGAANLALAGLLDIPLGRMLIWGIVVVVPTVLIATAIMLFLIDRGLWKPDYDELADEPDVADSGSAAPLVEPYASDVGTQASATQVRTHRSVPLPLLFLPLATGLVLIAIGSIAAARGAVPPGLGLISDPVVALFIALLGTGAVGYYVIGRDRVEAMMTRGFQSSGEILVITGVGGSLAAVVTASGLGDVLQDSFSASTVAPLLLVWAIAAALHMAIGSVTLAALTAAGILAPIMSGLGTDPVLIALAAGAGSMFAVHVTANAFWMLQTLLGQTTRGTLKSCTLGVSVASVVALLIVLALSLVM